MRWSNRFFKVHTEESIETCGAEVQKGNPPTERKIRLLFRRRVSKLIKKCNDFGAGGVFCCDWRACRRTSCGSDKVPKNMQVWMEQEIAISESQANGGRRSERCGRIHVLCKGRKLDSRSCSSDRISETGFGGEET